MGSFWPKPKKAGFDVLLTAAKINSLSAKPAGPQNRDYRPRQPTWRRLRRYLAGGAKAVKAATPGSYVEVDIPSE